MAARSKATWKAIRNGMGQTVAYVEMFADRDGRFYTVPGASRWIDGPTLDESKAR